MKTLPISPYWKKIVQATVLLIALSVASAAAFSSSDIFAANEASSADAKKLISQTLKQGAESEAENSTVPKTEKSLIAHELTHVKQSESAQDDEHKEWINIESVAQSAMNKSELTESIAKKKKLATDGITGPKTISTKDSSFGVEREMKESGEKGGTTDMNIGLGELQEATVAKSMDKTILRKRPSRTTYSGTKDSLKLTTPPIGYVCEGGGANDECFCDGVLDCNKLWISDACKADTEWQDGNDSSKGGCTAAD